MIFQKIEPLPKPTLGENVVGFMSVNLITAVTGAALGGVIGFGRGIISNELLHTDTDILNESVVPFAEYGLGAGAVVGLVATLACLALMGYLRLSDSANSAKK